MQTMEEIRRKLWTQLSDVTKRRIVLQDVRADPEKGFMALEDKLADRGVKLEPAGPNEHVPYKLPLKLLIFLVYFVVSRINMTFDSEYDS